MIQANIYPADQRISTYPEVPLKTESNWRSVVSSFPDDLLLSIVFPFFLLLFMHSFPVMSLLQLDYPLWFAVSLFIDLNECSDLMLNLSDVMHGKREKVFFPEERASLYLPTSCSTYTDVYVSLCVVHTVGRECLQWFPQFVLHFCNGASTRCP